MTTIIITTTKTTATNDGNNHNISKGNDNSRITKMLVGPIVVFEHLTQELIMKIKLLQNRQSNLCGYLSNVRRSR